MADKSLEKTKYFVLAFALAFAVLSLLALCAAFFISGGTEEIQNAPVETDAFYLPRAQDNLTVLLLGNEQGALRWAFLARLDVQRGELPVAALPVNLRVGGGAGDTLDQIYARDGAMAAKRSLSVALGIPIDRYAAFTEEATVRVVDTLGSLEYELPLELKYNDGSRSIRLTAGRQALDGRAFCDVLAYPAYENEERRGIVTADLVSAYLNAALQTALRPDADELFRTVVNLVETDLSFLDYDNRKEALHFLAKLSGRHAFTVLVRGVKVSAQGAELGAGTTEMLQKKFNPSVAEGLTA